MRKQPIFEEHFDSLINCYATPEQEKKLYEFFDSLWATGSGSAFKIKCVEYSVEEMNDYVSYGIGKDFVPYWRAYESCLMNFHFLYLHRNDKAEVNRRCGYFTEKHFPILKSHSEKNAAVLSNFVETVKAYIEDDSKAKDVINMFNSVKKVFLFYSNDLKKLWPAVKKEIEKFEADGADKKEVKEEAKEAIKLVENVDTSKLPEGNPVAKDMEKFKKNLSEFYAKIAKDGRANAKEAFTKLKRATVPIMEAIPDSSSDPKVAKNYRKTMAELQNRLTNFGELIGKQAQPQKAEKLTQSVKEITESIAESMEDVIQQAVEEEMQLAEHEHEKAKEFQNALAKAYNQYLRDKSFENLCGELKNVIKTRTKHSIFSKSSSYLKDIVKNIEKFEKLKKANKLGIKHLNDLKKSIDDAIKAGEKMKNEAKRKKGHPPILSYKIVQDALSKIYDVVDKERDNSNL